MNPVLKTGRYNRWQANSKSDIFLLQPLSSKHNGAQFWPLSQTASSKALRKPFISFQPSPNLKCSVFFSSHIDLYLSEINGSWDNNEIQGKKWLLYKWPDTKWEIGYIPSELCILFLLYSRIKKRDYLFLWRLRKGCYEQQNFPLGREREEKQHSTSEMWSMKVEFRPSLHFLCLFIWMAARVQMLSSGRWTRLVGFHYSILLEAHLISRASGFISPQQVEGAANTEHTCLTLGNRRHAVHLAATAAINLLHRQPPTVYNVSIQLENM